MYWHIRWFDVPMHVMGGLLVGYSFYVLQERTTWFSFTKKMGKKSQIIAAISFVLFVGVLWEFFEPTLNYIFFPDMFRYLARYASLLDNIQDLVCDFIGGIVIIAVWWFRKSKSNTIHD
jgi:VanZ family protein